MKTENKYPALDYFTKYSWYLRALNAKVAENAKINADIEKGFLSRDTVDSEWKRNNRREIREIKAKMENIVSTIDSIPDTNRLMPCKLFLRLHYILGLTLTETAEKLNVSESTVRRIRDRAAGYFENYPFEKEEETSF